MIFTKGMRLKVTEGNHYLMIAREGISVKDAQPLLMTDEPGPLLQYLDRYLYGRLNGEDQKTAHEAALKECGVTLVLPAAAGKTIPLS